MANPNLSNFAAPSMYADNSYRHDMYFSLPPYNYQQLPSSTGGDTYYDCDGVTGYLLGADSENFLQNWDIWIHATADGVGIDETRKRINNLVEKGLIEESKYGKDYYVRTKRNG